MSDESAGAPPQQPSPEAQLRFRFPGEWWHVPLQSIEAATASIKTLVDRQFGRNDSEATFRSNQRNAMTAAAQKAIDGGAAQLHLSLKLDTRIVLASTLTEYRPALRFPGDSTEPSIIMDSLARGLIHSENPGRELAAGEHWTVLEADGDVMFTKDDALVLRRVRYRDSPAESAGAEALAAVSVDYWVTVPGRSRVVLVSFSSPLGELGPLLVELYDAMIESAEWVAPAARAGAPAQSGGQSLAALLRGE